MIDPAQSQVPPQLEARIAALEKAAPPSDFDAASWFWMVFLGIAIPLILLAVGWWA
jgi:hypothetical protein